VSQTAAVLRAHETGQHLTYREVCNATGLSLKRVMSLAHRLRELGVLERIGDSYPARNAITAAGIAYLHSGKPVEPSDAEPIVESAKKSRPALQMVWGQGA
jgi:DNA-binding IclR family transcriptional regulator